MHADERRKQLQKIVNDPTSTPDEVAEAKRELHPPEIQEDALLERWLTGQKDPDDHRYGDELRALCRAIRSSRLLWLFTNNAAEIQLLIALHGRTRSELVRLEVMKGIEHIAKHSTINEAKLTAQQYLNQLRTNQNE